MSEAVVVESIKYAIVLRFNRPEMKNSLSVETLDLLEKLVADLESHMAIKTIIFTGSGDTFASGANLNEIARLVFIHYHRR